MFIQLEKILPHMSSILDKQCDLLWRSITHQFDCKRQSVLAGHRMWCPFLVSEQFMGRYHRQQCHNSNMNPMRAAF